MKGSQLTIKDIAEQLGLSKSTVSRALKDHPDISEATKKAVKELAKKLDYQPNTLALSLRQNRSNIVGVIVPDLVHYYFSTIISGIQEVAYAEGFNVMICQSEEKYEREVADAQALFSSRVDGLLVSPSRETTDFSHFTAMQNKGIPVIYFDRGPTNEACMVLSRDFEGAFAATEHLIEQGCTRIAHLSGPKGLQISRDRERGYKEALQKHKLPVEDELIVGSEAGTQHDGAAAMNKLLALKNRPDGVFGNNDLTAIGAMLSIHQAGLQIPTDIAVIGYSNWQTAEFTYPPLSSVQQPGFDMGQEATKMFLEQLRSKEDTFPPQTRYLDTKVVVRESSLRKR